LILDDTKPKLASKKWQEIDGDFNPKEHILTHKDLIKETKILYDNDRPRFDHIKRILEEEINQKLLWGGVRKAPCAMRLPPGRRRQKKQIKILSITASPDDAGDIYYEIEQDTLLEAFKSFDREAVFLDMPAPQVVILSACHSARKEPDLMPVATALYDAGIKTVIGMKKAISHAAAIEFNVAFFKALCREETVEKAF
jgi:hypothetical protein